MNQSNHNLKQTGFDDFFKNNSSEIKHNNDFNFDFGNSNVADPFKHEEAEQSSNTQNNFKKKRYTFHEDHNPFEFQNNYQEEEAIENENEASQKDLEESKRDIEPPKINNTNNDVVNRKDSNQENMPNFMKNKSEAFIEGNFNNFANFPKISETENSPDKNFEKDFGGFGFQQSGVDVENHEVQGFNAFDGDNKKKEEENQNFSQKNNYNDSSQNNKGNNFEEENVFNNKIIHTTSQYFEVAIPNKNNNIKESNIKNDFDEGWKEVPQWGFNQPPEKNVSKNEIFNQWEEQKEDIIKPSTKSEINFSPYNEGFGNPEPKNKEIENFGINNNYDDIINGSSGWNYDNQINAIPEIPKKPELFEENKAKNTNDIFIDNFPPKIETQNERMHYPSLNEEKYNLNKNWIDFSEKNENETSMKSSFPKPAKDFEKSPFVPDNNTSFEFIVKDLKPIAINLEQGRSEIIQDKPFENILDFKKNDNKPNDFNLKNNNFFESQQNMGYQYPTINEPSNYMNNNINNNFGSNNNNNISVQNGLISQAQKNEKSLLDWGVDEIATYSPEIINESSLIKGKNSDFFQISENLKDLNFNVNSEQNQEKIKNYFSDEKDHFSQTLDGNFPQLNQKNDDWKEEKKMNEKPKNDVIIKKVFVPPVSQINFCSYIFVSKKK